MESKSDQTIEQKVVQTSKELSPQEPWSKWREDILSKTRSWFSEDEKGYLSPNDSMPQELRVISFDLPHNEGEVGHIRSVNKIFFEARKGQTEGTFYRPGLGYGEAMSEILEKIGCFDRMIITDPVYVGQEIKGPYGEEALLPVDYFCRTLKALDSQNLTVEIIGSGATAISNETGEYQDLEIPPHGKAVINFDINGVSMTIELLSEDMTTYDTGRIDILGLGRPTPTSEEIKDPRNDSDFLKQQIERLNLDGLIDYTSMNFRFLPSTLPPEAFGLNVLLDTTDMISDAAYLPEQSGVVIIQKNREIGREIGDIIEADKIVKESIRCLSGEILVDEESGWTVYMSQASEMLDRDRPLTTEDVYSHFTESLHRLHQIVGQIGDPEAKALTLKRLEFLYMSPISEDGSFSEEKVKKIQAVSTDPDIPNKKDNYNKNRTYFGDLTPLIRDHNSGKLNLVYYYHKLYDIFYSEFSEIKK